MESNSDALHLEELRRKRPKLCIVEIAVENDDEEGEFAFEGDEERESD